MSRIIIPGSAPDSSLPIDTNDAIINAGSLFCFDLADPFCWPTGQVPANGQSVPNLVSGAPAGAVVMANGSAFSHNGKGLVLADTSLTYFQWDSGTQYFQSALANDYLIVGWARYPGSDPGGYASGYLISKMPSVTNSGTGIFLSNNYTPRIDAKFSDTATNGEIGGYTPTDGTAGLHQLALAKIGSSVYILKDGTQRTSAALLTPALTAHSYIGSFGSRPYSSGSTVTGIQMSRIWAENLTTSAAINGLSTLAQALNQIAYDYTLNASRF